MNDRIRGFKWVDKDGNEFSDKEIENSVWTKRRGKQVRDLHPNCNCSCFRVARHMVMPFINERWELEDLLVARAFNYIADPGELERLVEVTRKNGHYRGEAGVPQVVRLALQILRAAGTPHRLEAGLKEDDKLVAEFNGRLDKLGEEVCRRKKALKKEGG
jgi:hypothetical protein